MDAHPARRSIDLDQCNYIFFHRPRWEPLRFGCLKTLNGDAFAFQDLGEMVFGRWNWFSLTIETLGHWDLRKWFGVVDAELEEGRERLIGAGACRVGVILERESNRFHASVGAMRDFTGLGISSDSSSHAWLQLINDMQVT